MTETEPSTRSVLVSLVTVIFFGQQDTKEALSGAQHSDGLVDII